jgi:hypothetical protein
MKKSALIFPLLLAVIFPLLFHKQQAGLNMFMLDLILIFLVFYLKKSTLKNPLTLVLIVGSLISGFTVLLYGSVTSITVNVISLILLSGILAAPSLSVLLNGFITAAVGGLTSPYHYFKGLNGISGSNRILDKGFRYAGLIILPIIILLIFVSLYSAASPYYNQLTGDFTRYLNNLFNRFFNVISPPIFWIGIAGLASGVVLLFSFMPKFFELPGEKGDQVLLRQRKLYIGSPVALKSEYRTALLMFIMLNLALGVMNFLDLYHVWINFKWDGGFLKQFVHEGTWLLILSIIISGILVLWYFRENINFYSRNRLLKILVRIWLFQNMFLAFSVAVRNFWYMHYFNLAFKRIWVFAFLVVVIYGLFTVLIKVNQKKTLRFLLIRNSIAVYLIFTALSLFNWDVIIARFNINRSQKAFFHTDFMVGLDDSTLPILIMNPQQVGNVSRSQAKIFHFYNNYLSVSEYNKILLNRKKDFLKGYPHMHWLSWNLADYKTFKELQ